ncbi:MAG: ATP-binding protein [Gammaproteobacteria bacterium]|nr:ATP-binding protein [Gammaproteobacteria bacterium]
MITHRAEILVEIERRRLDLNLALLKVYNYYRVLVGLSLLAVISQTFIETRLGALLPGVFVWVAVGYTTINLASAVVLQLVPRGFFSHQYISFSLVLYDVLALTWLMYASGGVSSGLGALILVAVATGAIIVTGRAAALVAAFASISVLYEEFYLSLSAPHLHDDYFQAGVLGILYFAFSLAIQNLSTRLRQNDVRALTQAAELADLERVNRIIVQRMRTGIILVDGDSNIRMSNQSARTLIGANPDEELRALPKELIERLDAWRNNVYLRSPPFQLETTAPEIRTNFLPVRTQDPEGDVTIFIEDTGEIQQQAQQLKLASLGRLSAGIAHEIRNPLGAISHASQLLSESPNLDQGDQRLTDIIYDHCLRMNDVIENVLEMSRRAPATPVRLKLREQLREFNNAYTNANHGAEIEIDVEPQDTEIRMDPSQFHQVLTNLVQNGLRYSEEHSQCSYVRLQGGVDAISERPYLNIIDRGPGVDEAKVANLFEPFFTTEASGTGLGLYISRELCESNQARLSYSRHDDGGSCFRIIFAHPDRITL